jgi:hypothetical protein
MTDFEKVMRVRKAVVFKWETGYYGSVTVRSRAPIIINIGLHERRQPSRTYLHETLHVIYPDMSERDIRSLEEVVWRTMTTHQRFLLARKLYNRKWRTS